MVERRDAARTSIYTGYVNREHALREFSKVIRDGFSTRVSRILEPSNKAYHCRVLCYRLEIRYVSDNTAFYYRKGLDLLGYKLGNFIPNFRVRNFLF